MAFNTNLADILQALAEEQQQQPQRSRQQAGNQQRYQHPFFSQFYDDEDEGYYPSYYRQDPYSGFFPQYGRYQQPVNPRTFTAQRRQPQETSQEYQDAPINSIDDLFSILGQLSGAKPEEPKADAEEEQAVESKEKSAVSKEQQTEKKEDPSIPAPKEQQPEPQPQPKAVATKPKPALRRHSTAAQALKSPSPKIEVSTRNTSNPALPYTPQSNVYSTPSTYEIILAIPGASLNDLDIDFHPSSNEIVVKGTIPDPFADVENAELKISEVRTGGVERRFKFPTLPKIDDNAIKGKYVNGLLKITVPKVKDEDKPKVRKVTIEEVPDAELLYEETHGIGKLAN